MTAPVKPVNMIRAVWQGEHRFDAGRVGKPQIRIDGHAETGPGPVDVLLTAVATCSGIDVVDILAKRHTPVAALEVEVVGERRAAHPRRLLAIDVTYHVTGAEVERVHAERAVALSLERYCSVSSSLAPDIVVRTVVVLNGERGEAVVAEIGR
ncbi:MAG: OsmC family protein [Gemmatimonadota bacterium]|nr:OsmC family protein [Gemmatimonadota bacterium]MDE3171561.1 OsmC family protein [Gemmatimonadota bacterium]MDE3216028.1 OsmC family protein [Gemmatimonadota bacterium]